MPTLLSRDDCRRFSHSSLNLDSTFALPAELDLAQLDRWLVDLLELENAAALAALIPAQAERAAAFLQRSLLLARALFQAGRMPMFELPKIVSVQPLETDAGKYHARVAFPLVDSIEKAAFQLVGKYSLELCIWAGLNPPDQDNRAKFDKVVEREVLKPLHRMQFGGKSTVPVLRVAHALDIPFTHMGMGVYQLGWGSKARKMDRSATTRDSALGAKLSQNKLATSALLRMAGLPAPSHAQVKTRAEALAAASQIGFPVVVKPSDGERGEGVTVDVADADGVRAAFNLAHELAINKQVIVERQVEGVCHRLFIANGKLLYAVKRWPMGVTGDGERTVRELVERALAVELRKPLWSRSGIAPIDEAAVSALLRAGYTLESVPGKGILVPLRRIESTEWGGVDEDVGALIHPDNLAAAIRATGLFGLDVAGIDIISPDIGVAWHRNGAIINEVNFAPLFGGGEISRRHIPIFLKELLGGDGRIPIEIVDGEVAAGKRRAQLAATGVRCYLTSGTRTLDAQGQPVELAFRSTIMRVRALLYYGDVDAIVIAMEAEQGPAGAA